ncbi:MAG TPA: DUF3616 domain-containing protein [Thermoanaerobaculia bacterium]|nr:DUF3616 domain-containing protein [Thermoanaerobaculia bacterium]
MPAEEPGALNIEGLAAKDGKLLIGFRGPVRGGKALVVTLENPQEVLNQGAPASFATPIELDLDGLGIRSLEHWPAEARRSCTATSLSPVQGLRVEPKAAYEAMSTPRTDGAAGGRRLASSILPASQEVATAYLLMWTCWCSFGLLGG